MAISKKCELTRELEKHLDQASPKHIPTDSMTTCYVVDVMANLRKLQTGNITTFGEFTDSFLSYVQHLANQSCRIDLVFDSYIDSSIKDSERMRRAKKTPIDLHTIERHTPLPKEMDRFWASRKNKSGLQSLLHQEAKTFHSRQTLTDIVVSAFEMPCGTSLNSCHIHSYSLPLPCRRTPQYVSQRSLR